MSLKQKRFNKKILSLLIEKAKGSRSLRQFSSDCDISYIQLRKLSLCGQENPPGKKLLKKLAQNSAGDIEYEDFLFAAGLLFENENDKNNKTSTKNNYIIDRYNCLTQGQKRTVSDFIDYLLNYKRGM